MKDYISNKSEEFIENFLKKLDDEVKIGPAPLSGYKYEDATVEDILKCDSKIALKLFKEPSEFKYDDHDQVYIELDEIDDETKKPVKLYIDSDQRSVNYASICQEAIGKLPKITYDIECGGYPSRQSEAAALYKVAVINAFHEHDYEDEINTILSRYDFSRMSGADGSTPFTSMLRRLQEEADSITKVVLTCCTTKLVADSIKKDTSYKAWLKYEDSESLRLAVEDASTINSEFNAKFKDASSAKDKINIGEDYAKRRKGLIDSLSPDLAILFAIHTMDLNKIPGKAKRKIRNAAAAYVKEMVDKKEIQEDIDIINDFTKKLIRRAQRNYLSRMKVIRYRMWSAGIREGLIPKS